MLIHTGILFAMVDSWALVPAMCYRTTKITSNPVVQMSLFQQVTALHAIVAVSPPVPFALIVCSVQLGALKGPMIISIHGNNCLIVFYSNERRGKESQK